MYKFENIKIGIKLLNLCLLIILSSCYRPYYIANTHNVPLFEKRKQFNIATNVGGNLDINIIKCIDIQTSYSLNKYLAIFTNYMNARGGELTDLGNNGKGFSFEGGVGYYKKFQKKFVFEAFGGISKMQQMHQYSDGININDNSYKQLKSTKYFIMPVLGYKHKNFELVLSTQFSNLLYNDILNTPTSNFNFEYILKSKNYYLIEPAITFKVGSKTIKYFSQIIRTNCLNGSCDYFSEYKFSTGLNLSLAEGLKLIKKSK